MSNSINMGKSQKLDQYKDEIYVGEMENEIKAIEPVYNTMVAELEQSANLARYINEINRIWEALNKSHANVKILSEMVKENLVNLTECNLRIVNAGKTSLNDQKIIGKLQLEIQRALRTVDAAHTREQVAHETVENLRQQILRLHQQLEQKNSLNQDAEYSSIAKNKEALMKERERMVQEITSLKKQLKSAMHYQEELERKNSQTDLRVVELTQELENQTNEMSKEAKFKERFEDEILHLKKELAEKESEVSHLYSNMTEHQRSISQLHNTIRDQKSIIDKLNQNLESHQQRILKLTDDLHKEVTAVDESNQTITMLSKQMKSKEDMISKLITDLTKTSKETESVKIKLNRMEVTKNEIVNQKNKLQLEVTNLQRTMDNDKHLLDLEKRKVETLIREKEVLTKNSLKTAGILDEQLRVMKVQEQARFHLDQELDNNRYEMSRQVQEILAVEKEKDRYVSETVVLTKKVEATLEDVRLKQSEIQDFKKKLTQLQAQLTKKTNQYESARYELNTCSKNLLEAQDDILDMRQKAKVMTLQIEQLKDDIAVKETLLTHEQAALRKTQAEKETMRVEIQKCKDQIEKAKEDITKLNMEIESLQHALRKADINREKDRKEKEKIISEKDTLSTQLVRRNDEVVLLREKIKIFQSTMDKEQVHYSQRLEDIRLFKLEVQKLSNEKQLLTKQLESMADLRTEIHHLEKNLTKERLKSQALQEELQNPLNIHRWRKLEGSDPDVLELVQKVSRQQHLILDKTKTINQIEDKYNILEKQYQTLLESKQPLSCDSIELKRELILKDNKIKSLTAMVNMRESQAAEQKTEVEKLKQELAEHKKNFFEEKQKSEKSEQKLKASPTDADDTAFRSKVSNEAEMSTNKEHKLPVLPQKPYFVGGGFNMDAKTKSHH